MEYVNHPAHYKKEGRKECLIEMQEQFGTRITIIFCLTNAYKYLYRAGNKKDNPTVRDIEKAKWYCNYAKKLSGTETMETDKDYCISMLKLWTDVCKELQNYD